MKLSIIVPMFNEELFIGELLNTVSRATSELSCDVEIIVVDDGSTDSSVSVVENLNCSDTRLIKMKANRGKGAAVRFGIESAVGDLILIQDADLEYDPSDISLMLQAYISSGEPNTAVYGSRTLGAKTNLHGFRSKTGLWPNQGLSQWLFNHLLSWFHFLVSRKWVSDLLTGYKVYPRSIFENWQTVTSGFETDHEITMRLHVVGCQILEVPISYKPRTKEMGKKIRGIDGVRALVAIWRYRK